MLSARIGSRANLTTQNAVRKETLAEATRLISRLRQRLYANLPERKQDDGLRAYGFRPIEPSGGGKKKPDPQAPPVAGGPPVATS